MYFVLVLNHMKELLDGPVARIQHFELLGHRFTPWSWNQNPKRDVVWQKKKNCFKWILYFLMLCLLSNCKLPFCSFFVPLLSHVWNFATPWTTALQASLCFTISLSLLKLMSVESVMLSNHLILCHSLLLLPSIFPSIRVSSSHQVARVLKFQHQFFQWIFLWFLLGLTGLISLQSKGL